MCPTDADDLDESGCLLPIVPSRVMLYKASPDEITLDAACQSAGLQPYDAQLPRGCTPWRRVYVSEEFRRCIREDVPNYTRRDETQATPLAQIVAELRGFCAGEALVVARDFHCLERFEKCVWQLKTPDVRLVGWFVAKNWMVLHLTGDANVLHADWSNYAPLVNATETFRASLTPILPGPLEGVRAANVVSNRVR